MDRRNPSKPMLAAIVLAHIAITAATWRSIRRTPANRLRGSKTLWRVLSAPNTLGSVVYVLVGRRWSAPR